MGKSKKYSWTNRYENIEIIGKGGNAEVFRVKHILTCEEFALKHLYNKSKEKKGRFIDEINVMQQNYKHISGILPIHESSITEFWYTMPIATSIMDYIQFKENSIRDIVEVIIQLSDTLFKIHSKGLSHRDIKPSNIYFYNDHFCFGDFGLVDFPDSPNDFTRSDRGLGAIFTIAPEMKRDPKNADGRKADVFSLAKTMWMLLSGNERGFDGVYNFQDNSHSLRNIEKYKDIHLVELEEVMTAATSNSPDLRPSINDFKMQLESYLNICSDNYQAQLSDWKFINKNLFGANPTESAKWSNVETIINILNIVGTLPAYNHMFFSSKGGLDFVKAEKANEEDCIYIYDNMGFCNIVKPKVLHYETFNDFSWNYFLLELDNLSPIMDNILCDYEKLVEDYPSHYVSAQFSQYGVYDYDSGEVLPENFKVVYRYTKGKFLIVLKRGPYNQINATYDGRHGLCDSAKFREYIVQLMKIVELGKSKGYSQEHILRSDFLSKNPFVLPKNMTTDTKISLYPDTFINTRYTEWNFKEFFETDDKESNIKFYLTFKPNDSVDFAAILERKKLTLCSDGHIYRIVVTNSSNAYYLNDRNKAIELYKKCSEFIDKECIDNGFETPLTCNFSIEIEKHRNPKYLFSKEDIKVAMKNADDRIHNQLVVDENGYARVIHNEGYGTTYPVSHEPWDAGNMYVGKYSSLSTLEDDYIACLQGWLLYLKEGKHIYIDYLHENKNENDLIEEIKSYY